MCTGLREVRTNYKRGNAAYTAMIMRSASRQRRTAHGAPIGPATHARISQPTRMHTRARELGEASN